MPSGNPQNSCIYTLVFSFHSFIHSGNFYSATSSPLLLRGAPDYSTNTVGKGLAQGPYMAARAGVEPTTLRLRVVASTNAPPCPVWPLQYIFVSPLHYIKHVLC